MARSTPVLRPALVATYVFVAVVLGWTSFHARTMDVADGAALQQQVWNSFQGPQGARDDRTLLRIHASRILFPALMQAPRVVGVDRDRAFALVRLLTIVASLLAFHVLLRRWLQEEAAFAGTLFMAATLPITYTNYFEIPTDHVEILVFTAGIWAMHARRWGWFLAVVFLGTLNRESTAVLPFLLAFVSFDRSRLRALAPAVAGTAVWAVTVVGLRLWTVGDLASPHADSMAHNIPGLMALLENPHPYNNFLFWLYLLGAFWFVPYLGWTHLPRFFRRLLIGVPGVVAVYLVGGGYLDEARELVFLYPVMVPAALLALFPRASVEERAFPAGL